MGASGVSRRWLLALAAVLSLLMAVALGRAVPAHAGPDDSTNPTGVLSSATEVAQGADVTLHIIVTPGTNPASTGITVTGDLTAIGGSATQPFFNDGTHGDLVANDAVHAFTATVPPGWSLGFAELAFTVADAQDRRSTSSFFIKVIPGVEPPANQPPSVSSGGPYSVTEGGTVGISATGSDPDGDALTYAWDLDDDGSFETPGQSVTFSAASLDGATTRTIAVRVSDSLASATDTATVTVTNVAPSATLNAPATAFAGFAFTIGLAGATDPSTADTAAGFTYAFDCGGGSGFGAFGSASSATCPTSGTGTREVHAKIQDKDGGVREYTATVQVIATFDSLCALVEAYSSDDKIAEELCDKLAKAESAPTATSGAGHLSAFWNQVGAKTGSGPGKAFTAEEGALLRLLSTTL